MSAVSWHKPGQKVAMKDGRTWNALEGATCGDEPRFGCVYAIHEVCRIRDDVYFRLTEVSPQSLFDARSFVPVYPTIVEQLQKLDAPQPGRVTQDA